MRNNVTTKKNVVCCPTCGCQNWWLPSCITCRSKVSLHNLANGTQRLRCRVCRWTASPSKKQSTRTTNSNENNPSCVKCRKPTQCRGYSKAGRQIFKCRTCNLRISSHKLAHRPRATYAPKMMEHIPVPTTGEELLSLAASVTPAQLPPHIREDVQQAICLDLLTERVEAGALRDARLLLAQGVCTTPVI